MTPHLARPYLPGAPVWTTTCTAGAKHNRPTSQAASLQKVKGLVARQKPKLAHAALPRAKASVGLPKANVAYANLPKVRELAAPQKAKAHVVLQKAKAHVVLQKETAPVVPLAKAMLAATRPAHLITSSRRLLAKKSSSK